jgi:hypothetical protein
MRLLRLMLLHVLLVMVVMVVCHMVLPGGSHADDGIDVIPHLQR